MQCQNCSHFNSPNALECERCGAGIYGALAAVARTAPDEKTKKRLIQRIVSFLAKNKGEPVTVDNQPTQTIHVPNYAVLAGDRLEESPSFPPGTSLLFQVAGQEVVITRPHQEIWLGRFGGRVPPPRDVHMVNLYDFDAYRMGVSRLHATIRLTADHRLELLDLASSNGTRLNGHKLVPYEIYHLYDGDDIQLGQLHLQVYFLYP